MGYVKTMPALRSKRAAFTGAEWEGGYMRKILLDVWSQNVKYTAKPMDMMRVDEAITASVDTR